MPELDFLETTVQLNLFEKGHNQFGQNPLSFVGSGINKYSGSAFENALPANFITSGDAGYNMNFQGTILINDGTSDRVLLGFGKNLF